MKNKIFSILGAVIGLLVISVGAYYYFTVPQDVRVTNVTSSAAIISWTTRAPLKGKVRYNMINNNHQRVIEDERRYNHYVELVDLEAETTYKFMPGTKLFSYQIKGILAENFTLTEKKNEFTTFKVLDNPIIPSYFYGSVVCDTEDCYKETIVYAKVDGLTPVSASVNKTGGWSIDLSAARDEQSGGTPITSNSIESCQIYVESAKYGSSEIVTLENIVLGKKIEKNLVVKE